MTDEALTFGCAGETLFGVLSRSARPAARGVVVVVGGPQYRVGSHRQFVALARRLAEAGHAVLRFDVRGMGDSSGAARGFEAVSDDIAAAVDAIHAACPGLRDVVLWGLCDGASAALLYVRERSDARVAGLCLLNPWARSDDGLARTQVKHYYGQRLLQRAFWIKLAGGRLQWRASLRELAAKLRSAASRPAAAAPPFRNGMEQAWRRFDGPILLLLSGNDYTAREFVDFLDTRAALWKRPRLTRRDLPAADHTLSDHGDRLAMEAAMLGWLQTSFARPS